MLQHLASLAERLLAWSASTAATTSLAMVCLLHYGWYVYRVRRVRYGKLLVEYELSSLASEFGEVQSDRTLVRLENHILREIISLSECEHAIAVLLRRFINNPRKAFGFMVERQDGKAVIKTKRGMLCEPQREFLVANHWWKRLKDERIISLEGDKLMNSEWIKPLATSDRGRICELFLIAVGGQDEVTGVLVTSCLYPAGVSREQQVELAKRLMNCLASNVKKSQDLASHKVELRAAQEMLALRQITDRTFESPTKMTEEFLNALIRIVSADRGAMYVTTNAAGGEYRPDQARVRCGIPLQPNLDSLWQMAENTIVQNHGDDQHIGVYNQFDLIPLGVESLVRAALVAPLKQSHGRFGVICLSKRSVEPFEEWQQRLIHWASEHLAETMLRSLNFVVVERQARLDGLTQLANRRTFDKLIAREVEWADRFKENCSLILLDLDRFKSVNDTYGHQAGDDVLRSTADILRDRIAEIRCGDRAVLARYGGEELAVLLPGIGPSGAARIAETIRASIEKTPVETGKGALSVTASLGTSTYPDHADSIEGLIGAADHALYHAKETGRNRVVQATETLMTTS